MRIEKIDVRPVQESINPELMFDIVFSIKDGYEIPIEITGSVFSDENRKIANFHESMWVPDHSLGLSAEHHWRNKNEDKITKRIIASLNCKVLDYIETVRQKNKKGNVDLKLDIFVKSLISNTIISPIVDAGVSGGVWTDMQRQGKMPIAYKNSGEFSASFPNMYVLSGNESTTYIKTIDNNFKIPKSIPSSDWIHDYCPVFQIGRFSVFEYLLPDYAEGSGSIKEKLNESINAVKKMEENLIRGDWNGVIEDSRAVWELFKKEDEIKDLLKRDSYTEEAINEMCGYTDKNGSKHFGYIGNLFNLSSKFHHKLDTNKKLQPEIKASKEDAELIYATAVTFVNLISKKMHRLNT